MTLQGILASRQPTVSIKPPVDYGGPFGRALLARRVEDLTARVAGLESLLTALAGRQAGRGPMAGPGGQVVATTPQNGARTPGRPLPPADAVMTLQEVAAGGWLGSLATVERLVASGRLASRKIGKGAKGLRRVLGADVIALVDAAKVGGPKPTKNYKYTADWD